MDGNQVVGPRGATSKKILTVVGVVLLVVLAVGAGAGVRWWQHDRVAKKAAQTTVVEQKTAASGDLAANGKYDEAQKQLDEVLTNSHLSAAERYSLLFQKAINYENNKQYDVAIQTYQAAEALQATQSVAEAIGRTAATAGKKDLAISYYRKAIERIPANRPVASADKDRYEQAIKDLGGQP